MYCKKCGNKLQSDDLFCPKCGNVIEDEDRIKAENGVSETFDEFRNRENSFAPKVEEPEDEDLTKIYAAAGMMEENAPEEESHIADGYDEILERDRLKRKIEEAESRYTDTSERYSYDDDYSEDDDDGDDEEDDEEEEKPVKKKKKAKKKLTEEEKNKKNKKIIVAVFLICLAVIVLTIGIIAIVMHNNNAKKAAETSETSVTEVETTKKVKETTKYNETTRKETTVPETTEQTTAETTAQTTAETTTPESTTSVETTSDVPVVPPEKTISGTGKVAIPAGEGNELNVRSGPWGEQITSIPNGSTVTLSGSNADGSWYYVTYGGQPGWVLAAYVQTN